jgi:hypothetical protein
MSCLKSHRLIKVCGYSVNIKSKVNRLVLFNAHRYHMSMDYFGDTKENGRLFQTFFFSTGKN